MIENIRTHPTHALYVSKPLAMFEHRATKHLVEAQDRADQGAADSALEFSNQGQTCTATRERLAPFVRETPPTKQRAA